MRTVISAACALACAFPVDAQITATLNHLPDGSNEVRIRNTSTVSLVAFVVTVAQLPLSANASNAPRVIYADPLIDLSTRPLLMNEERVVMRSHHPSGRRHLEEPIVTAGILADGTTIGDLALLGRLVLRRSNMLLAVETTIETLSDAGRRNVPRSQLIAEFRKLSNSLNRWYLPPEQQVGRSVYQAMVGKLMNLPEMQAGAPFPPSSFVEQETAALNRQRVTLMESHPSLADAALISTR